MKSNMTKEERRDMLFSRSKADGDCMIWQGSFIQNYRCRYGATSYKSKHWLAHRLSFYLTTGDHPKKRHVMHSCDNGLCINPKHLKLGNSRQNMADAGAKKRLWRQTATHCLHGHEFTKENTLYYQRSDCSKMSRVCRKCKSIRNKKNRTEKP